MMRVEQRSPLTEQNSRKFTLEDGRVVTVGSGSSLPAGLPATFELIIMADSVIDVDGQMVMVRTKMQNLRDNAAWWKGKPQDEREHVAFKARHAVKDFLPQCDKVYAKFIRGQKAARKVWHNFCDDIAILAVSKLLDGGEVRVMADEPEMIVHEGVPAMKLLFFTVKRDLLCAWM